MINLVVCDDHDMVRTGLIRALQANPLFKIVGEAANAKDLLALFQEKAQVDVLLLDLNLCNSALREGFDLISKLYELTPHVPILIVSMHNDPEVVQRALKAGANGYVTKDSSLSILEEAIRHLHEGRKFLDPNLVDAMVTKSSHNKSAPWNIALTKRETEVMQMLFDGHRVSDIALAMGLSIKTISTHKVRLMEKLNLDNNTELVKMGMRYKASVSY
jgi:DNA-binding NarL/FixJ family response regulator